MKKFFSTENVNIFSDFSIKHLMVIFSISLFVIPCLFVIFAQAEKSPDAIAFRVLANPKHYSPLRWYNEKITVKGAPQQLLVDGYQAVRDGRTVYVSAANVVGGSATTMYTNIYIISYNNQAENVTQDIFGQILAHWRFNTNLALEEAGSCVSIDGATTETSCINDRECETGGYCNSLKGDIVRKVRRMADIADIETALDKYKNKNGRYPQLSAGSYLANKTVSTWPSWQGNLGTVLGVTLPIDPINRLGKCKTDDIENAKYYPNTCWNQSESIFAGTLPTNLSASSTLPANSQVYVYRATPDGLDYILSTSAVDPSSIINPLTLAGESTTDVVGTIVR